LAADYPFPFVHQFRFYHTTSHYLCHKMCYHFCLVEIALGTSRQFDGLMQKVHSHKLAYNRILSPISTIVIPPAKTGSDNNNKTAVITTAHANNINLCNLIPGLLILNVVVMTLKIVKLVTIVDYLSIVLIYGL